MNTNRFLGARPLTGLGLVGIGALALGLATAGPAAAAPAGAASVADDTLTVIGRNGSEELALRLAVGDANTLQVDFGDDGTPDRSFDRRAFTRIEVYLGNGSDEFRIDQVNGAFADETVTVFGGRGDDVLLGGDGAESLFGGSGDDRVDGNRGADTGVLGSGQDVFTWDPGDGSDVVEGGFGVDTLDFNGAPGNENMSLSANGARAVFFREQGNIRMDMDRVERLDLTALGGADTVIVGDMTGTDFRVAEVDLGGPDGQVDVLTINGTEQADRVEVALDGTRVDVEGLVVETRITGNEATDRLQIDTAAGHDVVDVDEAVFARIDVTVDLGPGQL